MPQPLSKSAMFVYGLVCAAMGLIAAWGVFHALGGELTQTRIGIISAAGVAGFILGAALEVRAHGNAVRRFSSHFVDPAPLEIVNTTSGMDYPFTIQATIRPGRMHRGEPLFADHEQLLIWESAFIKTELEQLREALDFTVDGIPPLRYVGPVDHFGNETTMMVEVEPLGAPATQTLSLPLTRESAIRLTRELAGVMSAAGDIGHSLGIMHPRLIYVANAADGPKFMGVTSRFNQFYQFENTLAATDDRAPVFDDMPFISPELAAGGKATPASDVFIAGAFLQWLLTGQMPFNDTDRAGYLQAVITGQRQDYAGAADALIAKCCATDPDDRISIDELKQALMQVG